MRRLIILITGIVLLNSFWNSNASSPITSEEVASTPILSIKIEQDDREIPVQNHTVSIKKKPFAIVVYFSGQKQAVFVNASLSPETYEIAKAGSGEIDAFIGGGKGMAEIKFNQDRSLFLTDDDFHYWYYKDYDDHRFDSVTFRENCLVCRRTVERVRRRNLQNVYESINVESINAEALYLVFESSHFRDYLKVVLKKDEEVAQSELQEQVIEVTPRITEVSLNSDGFIIVEGVGAEPGDKVYVSIGHDPHPPANIYPEGNENKFWVKVPNFYLVMQPDTNFPVKILIGPKGYEAATRPLKVRISWEGTASLNYGVHGK